MMKALLNMRKCKDLFSSSLNNLHRIPKTTLNPRSYWSPLIADRKHALIIQSRHCWTQLRFASSLDNISTHRLCQPTKVNNATYVSSLTTTISKIESTLLLLSVGCGATCNQALGSFTHHFFTRMNTFETHRTYSLTVNYQKLIVFTLLDIRVFPLSR